MLDPKSKVLFDIGIRACCIGSIAPPAQLLSGSISCVGIAGVASTVLGIVQTIAMGIIGVSVLSTALFFFIRFGGVSFLKKGNWITNIKNNLSSNLLKTLFKTVIVAITSIIGTHFTIGFIINLLQYLLMAPVFIGLGLGSLGLIAIGAAGGAAFGLAGPAFCAVGGGICSAGAIVDIANQNKGY